MVVGEIVVTVVAVLVGAIPLAKVVMGRNDDGVMILNSMTTSRFASGDVDASTYHKT